MKVFKIKPKYHMVGKANIHSGKDIAHIPLVVRSKRY